MGARQMSAGRDMMVLHRTRTVNMEVNLGGLLLIMEAVAVMVVKQLWSPPLLADEVTLLMVVVASLVESITGTVVASLEALVLRGKLHPCPMVGTTDLDVRFSCFY
uniref:Uncharacterized protein n=1 Tax=Anopheles culicifacies TaxID=139723 RepID=A0A182LS32_9DIPT